jgi:hypothetical protein
MRMRALGAAAEVAKEADADVVDREAFEEAVAADEVMSNEQLVAVAIGEHFLDTADALAVDVDDAAAEEQLQLYLILL